MNIIEAFKQFMPALALMAVCSAAILYLPQWDRNADTPAKAASDAKQKVTPTAQQERDKQA